MGRLRADEGQALPVLLLVAGTLVAATFWLAEVGRAASLRVDAQSAADAAALAAAEDLRSQVVGLGIPFGGGFSAAAACSEARAYAARNGADLHRCEPLGALADGRPLTPSLGQLQVRVDVTTLDELRGGIADRMGVAGERGRASARAEMQLHWREGCTVSSDLEQRLREVVDGLDLTGGVTYHQIGCTGVPTGASPSDAIRLEGTTDQARASSSPDLCRPWPLLEPGLFAHEDAVACGSLLEQLRNALDLEVRLIPDGGAGVP